MRPGSTRRFFSRPMPACLALAVVGATGHAQIARQAFAATPAPAMTAASSSVDTLPDAPSAALDGQPAGARTSPGTAPIAGKYQFIITPDQSAQKLSAAEKVKFAFVLSVRPVNVIGWAAAAGYSQAADSAPHFGQGWGPFGQRYGAAAARGTLQTLASDAIFAPIFHDDPRYYELGRAQKPLKRVVYAATRVFLTRNDNGNQTVNVSLLAGYAVAAAATNSFYPQSDINAAQTFKTYAGSLGGAAIGFGFNEFLDDGLRAVHLRK